MKTLKSAAAARIAIDPDFGGIAVSTLREAEYFADAGFSDIQLAICLTADKLTRAATLSNRIGQFSFFLDSLEMAQAAASFATSHPCRLGAWIEIDSGDHRTGLAPDDERLVQIATVLAESPVRLEGVATHGGHAYGARDADAMAAIAEEERRSVVQAAERLRDAGLAVAGVSAGSTPTASHAKSGAGLTEMRPGVYMAGDLFQAAVGSIGPEDMAVSVLTSVISHQPRFNQIVVDAGGLALSKDRSTQALNDGDCGFGRVVDLAGEPSLGDLLVSGVSQEHGQIQGPDPVPFDRLPIGARLRILPNHVCMTAGSYDYLWVVGADGEIEERWDKAFGW